MKVKEMLREEKCKERLSFLNTLYEEHKKQCSNSLDNVNEKECASLRGAIGLLTHAVEQCDEDKQFKIK